ncbi:hypothetical protein BGY98DRAFT_932368 [Russula aff. rugulosa BPL654]|nr:hypothetical protein BGY98DRAFT_932368 [Russula aff. rugulosa BPL654]
MRRYDIVLGILLILSIIDFALAAPVLRRDNCVVEAGGGRVSAADGEYFKQLKSVHPQAAHASSSSVPLGPGHYLTNEEQALALNPASSTANLKLKEPTSPPSMASYGDALSDHGGSQDPLPPDIAALKAFVQTHVYQVDHVQQPSILVRPSNPRLGPLSPIPSGQVHAESDFRTLFDLPLKAWVWPFSKPEASKNLKPDPVQQLNRRLSKPVSLKIRSPKGRHQAQRLTGPELNLDHQSLSTNSQPVDLQTPIYEAKGKTKELGHISGTAKDVGNAAPDRVAA